MPISHKYKLIFIHIPKCAGVSIWKALDLSVSKKNLISSEQPILQHLLPNELKEKWVDKKSWNSYKKFTIIRNPYDRVVSDFFWLKEHAPQLTTNGFDDFLTLREDVVLNNKYNDNLYYDHFYPMYFYFKDITYDHVIKFETLNEGYQELQKLFNIKNNLSKVNDSNRDKFVLNKQQRKRIYNLYKKDFILFHYEKDSNIIVEHPINKNINSSMTILESFKPQIKKELLLPLNEIIVQVFYTHKNLEFSENLSLQKVVKLNNNLQKFSFELPPYKNLIKFIRFDIGAKIGLINIHDIEIKTTTKKLLFTWDKYTVVQKTDSFLIVNEEVCKGGIVQLSFSDDPSFSVATDLKVQEQSKKGIIIDITLSSLNNKQVNFIKSITAPLSYVNKNKSIEDKNKIGVLAGEVDKLSATINNFKQNEAILYQEVKTKQLQIDQLTGDKDILITEGKRKDENIGKALKVNDNLDKLVNLHEGLIQELNQTKQTVTKQIVDLEKLTLINNATNKNNASLKRRLEESTQINNDLTKKTIQDKETLKEACADLEKLIEINNTLQLELKDCDIKAINQIDELTQKNKDLKDQNTKVLNELSEQNATLKSYNSKKEKELLDLKKQNKELNKLTNEIVKDFAEIKNSRSWKYTKFLRTLNNIIKEGIFK